jgi:hypothetical protein
LEKQFRTWKHWDACALLRTGIEPQIESPPGMVDRRRKRGRHEPDDFVPA